MSLQAAAQHLARTGRGDDTMLVHMTPREVGGLQALAPAHGQEMTINPETGLPEASVLSSILPMVIGGAPKRWATSSTIRCLMHGDTETTSFVL